MTNKPRLLFVLLTGVLFLYLVAPAPQFPEPPIEAHQSQEPGDVSDLENRRAYFINWGREEIVNHYQAEFEHMWPWSLIPSLRLAKYPPEEAAVYVYEPLLSSYLEELVYPFRESLFISGYEPQSGQDIIAFEGEPYQTKYTIRYYRSPWGLRIGLYLIAMGILYVLLGRLGSQLWALIRNK